MSIFLFLAKNNPKLQMLFKMTKIINLPYYLSHFIKKNTFWRWPFFLDLWHGIAHECDKYDLPAVWHITGYHIIRHPKALYECDKCYLPSVWYITGYHITRYDMSATNVTHSSAAVWHITRHNPRHSICVTSVTYTLATVWHITGIFDRLEPPYNTILPLPKVINQHCTVHITHSTLYTANCTMEAVQCTLYTTHCTMHIAHFAVRQQCSQDPSTLPWHQMSVFSEHFPLHTVH